MVSVVVSLVFGEIKYYWIQFYIKSLQLASSDGILELEFLIYSCLLFSVFSTLSQ